MTPAAQLYRAIQYFKGDLTILQQLCQDKVHVFQLHYFSHHHNEINIWGEWVKDSEDVSLGG